MTLEDICESFLSRYKGQWVSCEGQWCHVRVWVSCEGQWVSCEGQWVSCEGVGVM